VNFSVTINNYKTERKSILFLDHVATKHSFRGINVGTRSPALRYATTPNVRGEGIHVNQAFRTWEARGFTWIKHSECERRRNSRESSISMGWNFRHVHVVHPEYAKHEKMHAVNLNLIDYQT